MSIKEEQDWRNRIDRWSFKKLPWRMAANEDDVMHA
jgi:hypothetical protein